MDNSKFSAAIYTKEIDFRKELESLINKYSMESGSNTPDFILAEYLIGVLEVFDRTLEKRENWYGREPTHCNNPPECPFDIPQPAWESPIDYYEL
mgnify:CR=1 FL=1